MYFKARKFFIQILITTVNASFISQYKTNLRMEQKSISNFQKLQLTVYLSQSCFWQWNTFIMQGGNYPRVGGLLIYLKHYAS